MPVESESPRRKACEVETPSAPLRETEKASTREPKASVGRILELDALRGIAALAVVLFHYTTRYEDLFGRSSRLPFHFDWGEYGVDLFFMLSGFVILMTLERTSDSLKFAWGRFTRLYPAYWAAVGLTFVLVLSCGLPGMQVRLVDAVLNMTMIQALLGAPHVDGAYWSLQAELIFYVNMLLLFRWGAFTRPVRAAITWVGLAILMILAQRYLAPQSSLLGELISKCMTLMSLKFIALFAIGILVFDARRRTDGRMATLMAILVCFAAVGLRKGPEVMLIDVVLASLFAAAVYGRLSFLNARWLVFLGAISYSLYLTHQNIGFIIMMQLERVGVPPVLAIVAAIAVAFAVAIQLHRLVEKPALEQLRRVDIVASWHAWRQRLFGTGRSSDSRIG
ncbi:MAG: acyltransferase family protein [Rubripirellula sp.]